MLSFDVQAAPGAPASGLNYKIRTYVQYIQVLTFGVLDYYSNWTYLLMIRSHGSRREHSVSGTCALEHSVSGMLTKLLFISDICTSGLNISLQTPISKKKKFLKKLYF